MLKVSLTKHSEPALNIHFESNASLIALFGPSGAGKSSTLAAIAGLLQPDVGHIEVNHTIFFDSRQQINLPPHKRRVGYVFQNNALFPHLDVAQNIGFALNRWPRRQRQLRVQELLTLLDLQAIATQSVQHISGGQAQRVALARAIAVQPKLLLLDEPFSALDDDLRIYLRSFLKVIQQELEGPVVFVTHSRAEALELADQVILLEAGQVSKVGNVEEILDRRLVQTFPQFRWG